MPGRAEVHAATKDFPAPDSTAIWSDAAVWVPWALWRAYGDSAVLADQFDSMAAPRPPGRALLSPTGLWDAGFQFGDWLDPDRSAGRALRAKADNGVVATACLYRSAPHRSPTRRSCSGRDEDAEHFAGLADRTRAAFNEHYVHADGTIHSDCRDRRTRWPSSSVCSTPRRRSWPASGWPSSSPRAASTSRPASPARRSSADALTKTGHLDDAYRLLLQRECPSWLYPVTMGATTIWERWDSMLPDGTINPGEMTSFNHYALGAVARLDAPGHRRHLSPLAPGYAKVLIAPQPGGGLTWARTSLETRHGLVSVAWRQADKLTLDVELPDQVTAVIRLPDGSEHKVGAGQHRLSADVSRRRRRLRPTLASK